MAIRKRTYRKTYKQTGRSVKRVDRKLRAKPVGYRRSATGKRYYEARRNRSDKRKYL